ncbi:MAG TPA: signal peptidase II [Blastocatellia bacterium]|nr:signal peptidase II [Blastocatellia bacterium]
MTSEGVNPNTRTGKGWCVLVVGLVLTLDQFTKLLVSAKLREGDEITLIGGLLNLNYTKNPGIAFGMLNNGNVKWLLVAISVAAVAVVAYYLKRTRASNRLLLWSLSLLAAGISGNLVDRVRMGTVIDFIDVYHKSYHWPVFNVADTAITIGAALMAIELFLAPQPAQVGPEESRHAEIGSSD